MRNIYLALLTLFLAFAYAPPVSFAQNNEDISSLLDEDEEDRKSKKKKTKAEEAPQKTVQLDERFYFGIALDLATIIILVGLIYYPNYQRRDIVFTFFIFNIVIFLLTLVLNHVKISMGAAFGLFAVFSMLRYRTEGISMKDMTYLFIVIAVGLICAIPLDYLVLGIICAIIVFVTFLLDGNLLFKRQFSKMVLYDNVQMIKPDVREALIEDLKGRTGLNIYKVSIVKIDYLRDTAQLEIFYYA